MLVISLCHSNADGSDVILEGNEHVVEPSTDTPTNWVQHVLSDGPVAHRHSSLPIPTVRDPKKTMVTAVSTGEMESSFSAIAVPDSSSIREII